MPLRPFMAQLLAGRVEREHRAMTDEAWVRKQLEYVHRGEPLQSLRLDHPEKAIRSTETLEQWLQRISESEAM